MNIHEMKEHDSFILSSEYADGGKMISQVWLITRVATGWIYKDMNCGGIVFVPLTYYSSPVI